MSVKVRPDRKKAGAWEVDINVMLPDGMPYRLRRRAPTSSRSGAERWANDHLAHVLKNGRPSEQQEKHSKTLAEFAETFLEHARANRQKASTIYAKQSIITAHLEPMLGTKRLDEIGPAEVQALKAALKEHKPKTVNNVLAVLSKLLKVAHDLKEVPAPPGKMGMLPVEQDEAPYYDFGDYARLCAGAVKVEPLAHLMVRLGGDAGLREGEMLALERGDLDFPRSTITIRRSIWKGIIDLPKGGKIRRVPMTDALKASLLECRHLRSNIVICQPDGSRFTTKRLAGLMRRAQRRAEMEETGWVHILRHTFCSHLAMRGATAKSIQELAGHKDLKTTMRYMHLSPAAKSEAIDLLNARPEGLSGGGAEMERQFGQ